MYEQPTCNRALAMTKYFSHFIPHREMHLVNLFIRTIGDRLDSSLGRATSVTVEHYSWAPAPTTLRKQDLGVIAS